MTAGVDPTVNTGVTVVLPDSGCALDSVVNCGFFSLNSNGEMTGTHLIEESGIQQGPIILTNTVSLGTVRSFIKVPTRQFHQEASKASNVWDVDATCPTITEVIRSDQVGVYRAVFAAKRV